MTVKKKPIDWRHIAERQWVHFLGAPAVMFAAHFGVNWLRRRFPLWWDTYHPVILATLLIALREIYDVAMGGDPWKSAIDIAWWCVCLFFYRWLLRRAKKV